MVSFTKLVFAAISCASVVIAIPQAASTGAQLASSAPSTPPLPGFKFLYTSFVNISAPTDYGLVPEGDRLVISITGGNFTGPQLNGMSKSIPL
jgi:hypothetical protein